MSNSASDCEKIITGWEAAYQAHATPSIVDFRRIVNGITPDRYTHLLHSYPAKLLPQIPAFFLQSARLVPSGPQTVLADPFCGSGTVLLEGMMNGLSVIGADTNPLARLIAKVKTTPITGRSIANHLVTINRSASKMQKCKPPPVVNLSQWYSASVATELTKFRAAISDIRSRSVREFMLVCLSVCARKMSYADPRLSVPVRINLARKAQYGSHFAQLKRHVDHLRPENVAATFSAIVTKNAARMESMRSALIHDPLVSIFEDARTFHEKIEQNSVDLLITSPPYIGAQKYIRASSLSLGWLDIAYDGELRPLERKSIGREHFSVQELKTETHVNLEHANDLLHAIRAINPLRAHIVSTYLVEMQSALYSMHRALKSGGHLIMITGPNTVCGYHFDTPAFIEALAHRAGFITQFKLIDHIRSRGLMTKRNRTAGIIASECVLSLRKR